MKQPKLIRRLPEGRIRHNIVYGNDWERTDDEGLVIMANID